jgi:hypothetical protein
MNDVMYLFLPQLSTHLPSKIGQSWDSNSEVGFSWMESQL